MAEYGLQARLDEAAHNLSVLCQAIDEGNLDDEIQRLFGEAKSNLATCTGRVVCLLDSCAERLALYERMQKEIRAATKRVKAVMEHIEQASIDAIERHPDLPFKSDVGNLRAHKSPPKVVLADDLKLTTASLSNVIDAKDIERLKIDEKYYEARRYYVLMLNAIKDDLKAGRSIDWARIEQGKHLGPLR